MLKQSNDYYSNIPATHQILDIIEQYPWSSSYSHKQLVETIRQTTQEIRNASKKNNVETNNFTIDSIINKVHNSLLQNYIPSLRKVINATGIILHTNLGRAPLIRQAVTDIEKIATGYCNLELDIEKNNRMERYSHLTKLLTNLTGAEDAIVVNNDAAAVLLILDTFAKGKDVVVSRGELIEIGGSFRLPDVMIKSGANLVEVGTTNRTYISDYEKRITDNTAILFKAHTSNYAIIGFTSSPDSKELAELGKKRGIITVEDVGNGLFVDLTSLGINHEPVINELVKTGIDLIAFSGDKLLGGPQTGIIVGRSCYIEKLKQNPLARAIRIDKLHIAALQATLSLYENNRWQELPLYKMLTISYKTLKKRAKSLANTLEKQIGNKGCIDIWEGVGEAGGGTLPSLSLPTWLVAVKHHNIPVDIIAKRMRLGDPPLIGRIAKGHFVLDPRTIDKSEYAQIPALFYNIFV